MNHIYNENGKKQTLEQLLKGDNSKRWSIALSNELGRLTQGNNTGVTHQNAIDFIFYHEVPTNNKVTYANFVCDYCHLKDEPWRVQLVVSGNKLTYNFDFGSQAALLLETKLLFNSVISDTKKGTKFMSLDLKDFFLASLMSKEEYMHISIKYIPANILKKYKLKKKVHNGYIYC